MTKDCKYAVLIDADNTSWNYFETVFDLITNEGDVTYRRIYGDWTDDRLKNYKEHILKHSLNPVQQFSYTTGKNATDFAMVIDAMDILYQGNIDGFCIVSSDSDFTKLVSRLREAGKTVIGMGRYGQTPQPFIDACNEFKYIDKIEEEKTKEAKEAEKPASGKKSKKKKSADSSDSREDELKYAIAEIIEEKSDASGWMLASKLGELMIKKHPDFDSKHYGYKKLADLLSGWGFEIKKEHNPNNTANPNGLEVFVKNKAV